MYTLPNTNVISPLSKWINTFLESCPQVMMLNVALWTCGPIQKLGTWYIVHVVTGPKWDIFHPRSFKCILHCSFSGPSFYMDEEISVIEVGGKTPDNYSDDVGTKNTNHMLALCFAEW